MISIIVPVKNEELRIAGLLEALTAMKGQKEIIVVDGASSDKTVEIARRFLEVTVLETDPGRGHQLCCGVAASRGDILWFVHGDSTVDPESLRAIERVFANSSKDAPQYGCFSLYFDDADSPGLRFISRTSNTRARRLKLMFGDQGIFISRKAYEATGGFKPMPIMEDWEYSRRLAKYGPIAVVDTGIGTSGRRFVEGGVFKTLMQMHWRKTRYYLGVSLEKLAREYKETRS